jgi:hypothetical protein
MKKIINPNPDDFPKELINSLKKMVQQSKSNLNLKNQGQKTMNKECIMERKDTTVTAEGMTASIPRDISMLALFAMNPFTPDGDYREDGWVYVDNKPVKKWFKKIMDILIWFPILNDIHKLQERYQKASQKYKDYLQKIQNSLVFEQVEKVGKAHAQVTHKYSGKDDSWWLYTFEKYPGYPGISWDWVETPKKPLNLEIGNAYYKAEHRLQQLSSRVYMFQTILEYAIAIRVNTIKGEKDQILQFKVGNCIYWFKRSQYSWEKLAFPENEIIVTEI